MSNPSVVGSCAKRWIRIVLLQLSNCGSCAVTPRPDKDLYIANRIPPAYTEGRLFSRKLDKHHQHNFRDVFVES